MKKLQREVAQMEKEKEKRREEITSTEVNQGYCSDAADDYTNIKSLYAAEANKKDFAQDN